jgi:asparagine synthase (glutamine-hydrolysing)
MCGVYFRISRDKNLEDCDAIDKKILDQLSCRGPDGTFQKKENLGQLCFGFTRLGIRAIKEGNQPYGDERFTAVFNGEIYNYDFLKNSIVNNFPEENIPVGDMQLLGLWLYLFGPTAIKDVVGMFAGYLKINNEIYVFRDRTGEKPLFYGFINNSFIISSYLPKDLGNNYIIPDLELVSGFNDGQFGDTFFSLTPGTYIAINLPRLWTDKSVKINTFWVWPKRKLFFDHSQRENDFESTLSNSVKSQLVSDVGMGVLLSGGIDSGIVAALARKEMGSSLVAFTLSFKGSVYDESKMARETAKHLKLKHEVIEIDFEELAKNVNPTLAAMDVPIFDSGCLSLFTISAEVAKQNKVALTGDGGDELFRGYSIFNHSLIINLLANFPFKIPIQVVAKILLKSCKSDEQYLGTELKLRRSMSIASNNRINPLYAALGPLGGTELYDLLCSRLSLNLRKKFRYISKSDIEQYYVNEILPKVYLVKSDRMSMAHGLELRAPLLDHRVIESAFRYTSLNLTFMQSKGELKKVALKYLPESVINAPKHGFSVPFQHVVKYLIPPDWKSHRSKEELDGFNKVWSLAKQGNESAAIPAWNILVREHFFPKN